MKDRKARREAANRRREALETLILNFLLAESGSASQTLQNVEKFLTKMCKDNPSESAMVKESARSLATKLTSSLVNFTKPLGVTQMNELLLRARKELARQEVSETPNRNVIKVLQDLIWSSESAFRSDKHHMERVEAAAIAALDSLK